MWRRILNGFLLRTRYAFSPSRASRPGSWKAGSRPVGISLRVRDDFEDLEDKIAYYERREDEALEIIRNANAHAAQFLDEDREQLLSLLVLARYFAVTGQLPADPAVADLVSPTSRATTLGASEHREP